MDENLTPSELLRYFANGNFEIVYRGKNTVIVTGKGSYGFVSNDAGSVEVQGVLVHCRSNSKSAAAYATADFKIELNDGVPRTMQVSFSDLETTADEEALLPVQAQVKVTMRPGNPARPFQVRTTGKADFEGGERDVTYAILYAGTQQLP